MISVMSKDRRKNVYFDYKQTKFYSDFAFVELIGSTEITLPRTIMQLPKFVVTTIGYELTLYRCDITLLDSIDLPLHKVCNISSPKYLGSFNR